MAALQAALPAAEERLDKIAAAAKREALDKTRNPEGLLTLIDYTRGLSAQ
jgi:hypothetical protein